MAGVKAGVFICGGWQVTLCDPTWQLTPVAVRWSSINGYTLYTTMGHIGVGILVGRLIILICYIETELSPAVHISLPFL